MLAFFPICWILLFFLFFFLFPEGCVVDIKNSIINEKHRENAKTKLDVKVLAFVIADPCIRRVYKDCERGVLFS